ncbi:hypothetical protein [Metamycoplasma canadense]|uniref:hypothetical protein n=1 Tax=Metamycoplasma canadense TaxID=29554 RepID=UPI0005EE878C|nr:hypothetical protein [Metamycoplasma canadense]
MKKNLKKQLIIGISPIMIPTFLISASCSTNNEEKNNYLNKKASFIDLISKSSISNKSFYIKQFEDMSNNENKESWSNLNSKIDNLIININKEINKKTLLDKTPPPSCQSNYK